MIKNIKRFGMVAGQVCRSCIYGPILVLSTSARNGICHGH